MFDATGVVGELVGRTGAGKWVIGDIDMDGLSRWACTCLFATSAASLVTEMIQREAIGGNNTLAVDIRIILLTKTVSTLMKGRAQKKKHTNFRAQSVTSSNPNLMCSFGFSGLT